MSGPVFTAVRDGLTAPLINVGHFLTYEAKNTRKQSLICAVVFGRVYVYDDSRTKNTKLNSTIQINEKVNNEDGNRYREAACVSELTPRQHKHVPASHLRSSRQKRERALSSASKSQEVQTTFRRPSTNTRGGIGPPTGEGSR